MASQPSLGDSFEFHQGLYVCLAGVLLGFGLLMVHSASVTSWPTEFEQIYLSRQLLFVALGVTLAGVAAAVPADRWQKLAPYFFLATIVLLLLVMVPGLGAKVKGAQRWIRIAGFTLQPSELAKVALPLYLASILSSRRAQLGHWWHGVWPVALPLAILLPLVLAQPDLGTAVFLAGSAGLALLVGGWPLRNFWIIAAAAIPAVGGLLVMKPYQQKRILDFFETWSDWTTAPYQLKQSLMTMGTGGWLGVGLGKGWQKLSFLPEANTDFVFAVVGEELGFVGTGSLILAWCGLYLAGLRMLSRTDYGSFEFTAGYTLLTQLVVQAALNVAVVTAMVPPKGISHPLVSCGGSNLIVSLVALGIVFSLTRTPFRASDGCKPVVS